MAKEKFDFMQPIKDIPATLKGFPKNIVHIVKDPVESSSEIKTRRAEIYPYLYLLGALMLILIILTLVFDSAATILGSVAMIPGLLILGGIFLLAVLDKAAKKFANLECGKCGKRIAFDEQVQFKVLDTKFSMTKSDKTIEKDGVPYQSTISVSGKESVVVEITCKCQECGTEKTFTVPFVTMECRKTATRIPYVQSGAMLVQFESDVRNAYDSGSCNVGTVHPTTAQARVDGRAASDKDADFGVLVTYNRSVADLVAGYFGNELQMK